MHVGPKFGLVNAWGQSETSWPAVGGWRPCLLGSITEVAGGADDRPITHGGRPLVRMHDPSAASKSTQPGQQPAAPPGRALQPEPPQISHELSQQKS
mmetsp:Transcript_3849/g.10700  ORF Transcript_3849/g.10700 Transcript_3849/m.10700 type:complete len:97 (-) Transcript_3849:1287-1577(-)|eukprot:scaffold209810_cov28-Tisochrysis_lutea.AAC.3